MTRQKKNYSYFL